MTAQQDPETPVRGPQSLPEHSDAKPTIASSANEDLVDLFGDDDLRSSEARGNLVGKFQDKLLPIFLADHTQK